MKLRSTLLVLLCLRALAAQNPPAPIAANEPATPDLPSVKPLELPARTGITGEANITLEEMIRKALDNDRDLEVARIVAQEAAFNVNGAKGAYDPILGLNGHRVKSVTPVASLLGGSSDGKLTQRELFADPRLTGNSPWLGGSYALDFSSARQSSDSTFITLNPQFLSSVNLNLTQPLWRGLRFDENRYRLQVARKNVLLSNEQLRQRVIEIVTQVIQAYWELDYAYRNLAVQIEAVRLAEQQDASNRRQVKQGILAPVDVIQTQTQISTFQQNVFTAQAGLSGRQLATGGKRQNQKGTAQAKRQLRESSTDKGNQYPEASECQRIDPEGADKFSVRHGEPPPLQISAHSDQPPSG